MKILPKNKHEWLRALMFPFKTFVVLGTVVFCAAAHLNPSPRFEATKLEALIALYMLYDSFILLIIALILGLTGPKGLGMPCAGFALGAFLISILFLIPSLVR